MPTLLIDVDANLRQPGFKATRQGSMIPSPPKIQRPGSAGRRNLFSVSTTGSPCHSTMPTDSKAAASPVPTSKLPRKSTTTQSAFSKSFTYGSRPTIPRTSLPRALKWPNPTAEVAPSSSDFIRTTPPLSCNKPLPSPPIAQFVNPASPPKAQRTLVDAEAGTPTEQDWPVLRPENVTLSSSSALSTNGGLHQGSVSEGSALRRHGITVLENRVRTPLSVNSRTASQKSESSEVNECSDSQKRHYDTEACVMSSTNLLAKSFHAFSTDTEVAMDSLLAHRQQVLPDVAIPPRSSSKRNSLPSMYTTAYDSSAQLPASIRPGKSGCTKWPRLIATEQYTKAQMSDEASDDHQRFIDKPEQNGPVSFDGANIAQSHYGSIDSASTWSSATGSPLDDEGKADCNGSVRIKRLSWHSSNPNSGLTLRISADADAVLLGPDDSVLEVPALPENMLREVSQVSPSCIPKQVPVSTAPIATSRTPTPSLTGKEITRDRPVKITPIRSMQPPRRPSTGDLSRGSISLGTPASIEVAKAQKAPDSSQARSSSWFESPEGSAALHVPSIAHSSASVECPKNDYDLANNSTRLEVQVVQEGVQVLDTNTVASQSASRKALPMARVTPRSAIFFRKKPDATSSTNSPLLRSTERVKDRASDISSRSHSSASSGPAQSVPSQGGTRQLDCSRLRAPRSAAKYLDSIPYDMSSKEFHAEDQTAAGKTSISPAKRSFRSIFPRRDPKVTPQTAKKHGSKRSSVTGNTLTQRIRNSTNFSKVSLPRPAETKPKLRRVDAVSLGSVEASDTGKDRQAALNVLESCPVETLIPHAPIAQAKTTDVIHSILDHVTSMTQDSPDRLRGVEIAEAILHAVECSKNAKLSAELAREHARDAGLSLERAGLELKRLEMLCERSFGDGTMATIRQIIVAAGFTESSVMAEE